MLACPALFALFSYSLAIVAINLTGVTHHLLINGHLKSHFYNTVAGQPQIDDLHKVFGKSAAAAAAAGGDESLAVSAE